MNFLITEHYVITYDELVTRINAGQSDNFFVSFVADVVSNSDIDLSSYRFNNKKNDLMDLIDLQNRIKKSTSKIKMKTSGTTGKPKTIEHEILFLLGNTKPTRGGNIWLFTYNKLHMGGIQVLLQAIINNDTLVNAYRKDRDFIIKRIRECGVTNISATPTFYRLLLPIESPLEDVKRVSIGGERTDEYTVEIIRKMFPKAKINNIYATTEAGAVLFSKNEKFKINDRVCIKDGILYVLTAEGISQKTGDLVELVGDGEFVFSGRNTDIINIAGNNVNPFEIEDILKSNNLIGDAVVYSKNHKLLGNVLACNLVLLGEFPKQQIRDFLKEMIDEKYKIPRIIKILKSIEMSETNKAIR